VTHRTTTRRETQPYLSLLLYPRVKWDRRRRRRRRRKVYSGANAVNEEDPERDRAPRCRRRRRSAYNTRWRGGIYWSAGIAGT